ncbi:MAG: hypothetical protein DSY77_13210, partial [Bacteroidetes bacterium]
MNIFTPLINLSKVSRILLSLFTLIVLQTGFALAQDAPFITVWQTDNPGTSEDNQITIPGTGTDYLIEWEEVGNEAANNGGETGSDSHTITFPSAGTYRVKISGDFTRIEFTNQRDKEKILDIEQWGDIAWSSFYMAFYGCSNLTQTATDIPNLSNVTNMGFMFYSASIFNGDIGSWDVSNVTNLRNMFSNATSFNHNIGNWDVSNVMDMSSMFAGADNFNQDLSNWNVSNVANLNYMFSNATSFNQDIGNWFVSNVNSMTRMFYRAFAFNQDLSNWDVSNVTNMSEMFANATAFNQDIGSWDVSNVTDMESMFFNATSFNQDLSNWDVSNVIDMESMFRYATSFNHSLSNWNFSSLKNMKSMFYHASAFNQDLSNWDVSHVTDMSELFAYATTFNQDLSNWNVSNVTNMESMFLYADNFDQNLGKWNISSLKNMYNILNSTNVSPINYDSTLIGWANQESTPVNIHLGTVNNTFCSALDARFKLVNDFGWSISGDNYCSNNYFLTRWKTDNEGESNANQIIIPGTGTDYLIEWEQVGNSANSGSELGTNIHTLTFPNPGEYRVKISGNFRSIRFANSGDKNKLLSVDSWGDIAWEIMESAFYGCQNLKLKATNSPDLSLVKDMSYAFKETNIKGNALEKWNVSSVTSFTDMFNGASNFNQSLSTWDLSSAENLEGMLDNTSLSTSNYVATLNAWSSNTNIPSNLNLGAVGLNYCYEAGRDFLIESKNWTFLGDSKECSNQFVTIWQTDNAGASDDNQIIIPGTGTNYLIEWEEVGNEPNNNGSEKGTDEHTVTFPSAGTYRVKISGDFTRIEFGFQTDKEKILNIEQWGAIQWKSFESAFRGCSYLNQSATDVPDLVMVTNMKEMFLGASLFNGDISNWDVSSVNNMRSMFSNAHKMNSDISNWDVSNVTDMVFMFNQADSFNIDLSNWNVSKVTNMSNMFSSANSFNQNIEDWDVSNVTNFNSMFYFAKSFNQNLGKWNIENASNLNDVIGGSGLDIYNYDQTLIGWSLLENLNPNLSLGAYDLEYCISSSARNYLINEKGWTISGDSENCQSAFISSWDSDNEGESESNQITIPANGGDFMVLWEDINDTAINGLDSASGYHTVNFPEPGNYRIKIIGELSGIYFADLGDKLKITEIENWGDIQWTSMNTAFAGAENLTISANDAPDLSQVTDMSRMFYNAKSLNQDISHWDVSTVTNMSDLFHGASSFNQDISNWNVSNVTKMTRMFANTATFNQDLNSWNTANVEEMNFMFWDADAFQGNISDWNTENVTNMWGMFYGADSMNTDISNWDVSSVTNMTELFRAAAAFNQDINNWNTTNVEEMDFMFWDADAFQGNISDWNTENVTNMWGMFYGADSFNTDISTWNVSAVTNMTEM